MVRSLWTSIVAVALVVVGLVDVHSVTAQASQSLCIDPDVTSTATSTSSDALAGRIGGTCESFKARFGLPVEKDESSATRQPSSE